MDQKIQCSQHGEQTAYVTRNKNAYCPLCLTQGFYALARQTVAPEEVIVSDLSLVGENIMRTFERMHEVLHPHGDPDHEWSGETTDELSRLLYRVIPRPADDAGVLKSLRYNVTQLRERRDEIHQHFGEQATIALDRTLEELDGDLKDYDERHFIIPSMHASDESRKGWLVRKFIQCLTQHDGACLDNEAEREAVADYLADVLMALAR